MKVLIIGLCVIFAFPCGLFIALTVFGIQVRNEGVEELVQVEGMSVEEAKEEFSRHYKVNYHCHAANEYAGYGFCLGGCAGLLLGVIIAYAHSKAEAARRHRMRQLHGIDDDDQWLGLGDNSGNSRVEES